MNPLYMLLVYFVWFLSMYFVVLTMLILMTSKNNIFEDKKFNQKNLPKVSIIVSAYNEQESIKDTIDSLKAIDYPNAEFIIVNDGSKDNTSCIVKDNIDSRFIFIDNKHNKGKAACLNEGINISNGEYVATMDADSIVGKDIIYKTLPYFSEDKVGAVTVSVKVKEPKTFLHKIIDMEYNIGLSLFLKLFSRFNCVFVTPGPFSIYKKSVLTEIGCFDVNNITEDLEIAYRIHKARYKIRNCIEAEVYTLLPQTFKGLYNQRNRWYTGALKTCYQHKDMMFKPRFGYFGYFIPFNFALITFGLLLFLYSTYLGVSKLLENILYFRYTNFNFHDYFFKYEFDILGYGSTWFLSVSSFIGVLLIMFVGLYILRIKYKEKKFGILGYPFLFVLYQLFWLSSYISVITGRKIKWK